MGYRNESQGKATIE